MKQEKLKRVCMANGVVWQQKDAAAWIKVATSLMVQEHWSQSGKSYGLLLRRSKAYFKRIYYSKFCYSINPTQALLYQSRCEHFGLTGRFLAYSIYYSLVPRLLRGRVRGR